MKSIAVFLITLALTSASFAQTTIYWTGNEDRWGGGNQTGTSDDNFSLTPGGSDWQKVSSGETYHHVYDRSPAGAMAGANYAISMNRDNNTFLSLTLIGDAGAGFTIDTVAAKPLFLGGDVAASGGSFQFANNGDIDITMTASTTWDVASEANLLWGVDLIESTPGIGITKTGDGTLAFAGDYAYTGDTLINAGAFGVYGGAASLAGNLILASGTQLYFDQTYSLSVAGTATFEHSSFGIADLAGLDSSVAEGTYNLIAGTVSGTFDNVGLANAADIGDGKMAYFELDSLNLVVVPEPSTFALAALGIAGILIFGRRLRV